MKIRVAVGQFHDLTDERLRFASQIGATGLQMNNPTLPGDARWQEKDVRALVEKVESYGLKFEAIENVPTHFYHKAMMGLDGRDEQIENYQETIRAVARAGIPVLGYHFMPNSVWTTGRGAIRGGAVARQFDMAVVEASADDLDVLRSFMPTTLGRASSMPLFGRDGPVITEEQMCGQTASISSRRSCRWPMMRAFVLRFIPTIRQYRCSVGSHGFSTGPGASSTPMSSRAAAKPGRSISASAVARR